MKAKNWKKKSNFLLGKLRVVFLEMMDNDTSTFFKFLIEKMEANYGGKRAHINK